MYYVYNDVVSEYLFFSTDSTDDGLYYIVWINKRLFGIISNPAKFSVTLWESETPW